MYVLERSLFLFCEGQIIRILRNMLNNTAKYCNMSQKILQNIARYCKILLDIAKYYKTSRNTANYVFFK
jgi:hypothetical protein